MTNKVFVNFGVRTKVIFIQFEAWTTSYFKQYDYSKFINIIQKLDAESNLFGVKTKELCKLDISALVNTIDAYFIKRKDSFHPTTDIENIARKIIEKNGKIDIQDLYAQLKISSRTFQILFKKSTGLTLSKFLKIIKLRTAVDDLNVNGHSKTLTSVALDNAYYDQAHFIKIFKEIAGITPQKFNPKNYILSHIH